VLLVSWVQHETGSINEFDLVDYDCNTLIQILIDLQAVAIQQLKWWNYE